MSASEAYPQAAATVSAIAKTGRTETRPRRRRKWSLTAKTAFLAVVFILVPVFLYLEFRRAYGESQELLLSSVRAEGRAINRSLLPLLETADNAALPELGRHLERFASKGTTIKLLLRPADTRAGSDAFYYTASWPAVGQSNLRAEHDTLAQQGVLDRLAKNCRGEMPFSLIYHRPTGDAEIVTAVTPLPTRLGCWAVVASFSEAANFGQPYWATPAVRIAALAYLTMAAVTFSTLFSIRAGLRRFAERARGIRQLGHDAGSFSGRTGLPELVEVGAEFDRMLNALHCSAVEIRRTAEENAHAFKTPIAVIRQSLEPLRRALPEDNQRARRAVTLVERSLDRLDGLVAAARGLAEATPNPLPQPRVPVDLGKIIGGAIQLQSAALADRHVNIIFAGHDLTLSEDLVPELFVLGAEEMIERVAENLMENAVSFAPPGSEILVQLTRDDSLAHLTVSDQGPGLPVGRLEGIFDPAEVSNEPSERRFGTGLSIARRNIEAMGGTIEAENRTPRGLALHVHLPLAPGGG